MKKNSKLDKLINGKGFYMALAVCLVAIGASVLGIYYSVQQMAKLSVTPSATQEASYYTDPAFTFDEPANRSQSGVEDDRTTETYEETTEETSEETTEKPTYERSTAPQPSTTEATQTAEATETEVSKENKTDYTLPLGRDIIKDFSAGEMVYSATMEDWRVHNGIDFAAEKGSKVLAVCDGVVTAVIADELYGTVVVVNHSNGIIARYCGLEQGTTAIKDAKLSRGDTVGCLGTLPCEEKDGYHLHFEMTKNGKLTDPLVVMGKSGNN